MGLALYQSYPKNQIVETLTPQMNKSNEDIICAHKLELCMIVMLIISLLGVTGFFIMKAKKPRMCKGYLIPMHPIWCYSCQTLMEMFLLWLVMYQEIWVYSNWEEL